MQQEIAPKTVEAYNKLMEQDPRVFVFEKKEIFLIFVFVVIMSVTTFTLGVNLGKRLVLEKSAVTTEDVATVNMKSVDEESADKAMADNTLSDEEKLQRLMDESKDKLNKELQEIASEEKSIPVTPTDVTAAAEAPAQALEITPTANLIGKYTIQLGSYNSQEEAKQFAEGFTVRGYSPIIHQAVVPGKGTWYRVSLGAFETVAQAREYVKKEATLFQGQDYVIQEIR